MPRADAQRNVEALLTAATQEFAAQGVDVNVRAIAARAGVGTATLYRHFPLRSDLIAAVFRREVDSCAAEAPRLAASYGLNLYVNTVVTTSPVFGALGGGLILMTWFYLLCAALLIGAELNAILQARRRHRARQEALAKAAEPPPDPEDPSSVLLDPQAAAPQATAPSTVVLDVDRADEQPVPSAPRRASGG